METLFSVLDWKTGAAVKDLGPADQLNTEFSFSCSALLVLRGKD